MQRDRGVWSSNLPRLGKHFLWALCPMDVLDQKYHAALGEKPDKTFEKLNLFGVFLCSQLLPMLKSFFFLSEVCFNKCLLLFLLFFYALWSFCSNRVTVKVNPLNGFDVQEKQQQKTVATFSEASSCLPHNEDGRRLGV